MALWTANGLGQELNEILELNGEGATVRALRHLTNEGLIPVEGDVHTGTGHRRTYDEEGYAWASLMLYLNDWSIPVKRLNEVKNHLNNYLQKKSTSLHRHTAQTGADILVIGAPHKKNHIAFVKEDQNFSDGSRYSITISAPILLPRQGTAKRTLK